MLDLLSQEETKSAELAPFVDAIDDQEFSFDHRPTVAKIYRITSYNVCYTKLLRIIGMGITVAVAFGMPQKSWILFGIWSLAGVLVYFWIDMKRKTNPEYQGTVVFIRIERNRFSVIRN